MYTVLYVCTLLSLVASACGGPSVGDQVVLSLESTFGDQFAPRVSLTFSAAVTSLGALLWKPNATSSGLVSEADHAAYQQSAGSGYYRVRALHPSGAWVVGSVRTVRASAQHAPALPCPASLGPPLARAASPLTSLPIPPPPPPHLPSPPPSASAPWQLQTLCTTLSLRWTARAGLAT